MTCHASHNSPGACSEEFSTSASAVEAMLHCSHPLGNGVGVAWSKLGSVASAGEDQVVRDVDQGSKALSARTGLGKRGYQSWGLRLEVAMSEARSAHWSMNSYLR